MTADEGRNPLRLKGDLGTMSVDRDGPGASTTFGFVVPIGVRFRRDGVEANEGISGVIDFRLRVPDTVDFPILSTRPVVVTIRNLEEDEL